MQRREAGEGTGLALAARREGVVALGVILGLRMPPRRVPIVVGRGR